MFECLAYIPNMSRQDSERHLLAAAALQSPGDKHQPCAQAVAPPDTPEAGMMKISKWKVPPTGGPEPGDHGYSSRGVCLRSNYKPGARILWSAQFLRSATVKRSRKGFALTSFS